MPTFDHMTVAVGEYANPEFSFGDRIRKIRREVAQAYSAWESGRTKPDDIVAVAKRIAIALAGHHRRLGSRPRRRRTIAAAPLSGGGDPAPEWHP